MVKAVLLDAYGTLFDTGTGSVQAAQEILARNGREDLSPAEFYGQWKALHHRLMEELPSFRTEARLYAQGLAMLYRQYGFSRNPAEDVKVMLRYQGTRTAYPEVKAVVESLATQYLLCVASTTDTAPLLRDLARAGLRFQHVFTSFRALLYQIPCLKNRTDGKSPRPKTGGFAVQKISNSSPAE